MAVLTKPTLPIYQGNKISLKELSNFLGITQERLAQIINRDVRTVQRDTISKEVMNRIQPLIYALQMLLELTNNDTNEIKRWLAEPKTQWRGLSPLDCLINGNFEAVVNLVERIYYGDSSGY